jgi:hypothetical protein
MSHRSLNRLWLAGVDISFTINFSSSIRAAFQKAAGVVKLTSEVVPQLLFPLHVSTLEDIMRLE